MAERFKSDASGEFISDASGIFAESDTETTTTEDITIADDMSVVKRTLGSTSEDFTIADEWVVVRYTHAEIVETINLTEDTAPPLRYLELDFDGSFSLSSIFEPRHYPDDGIAEFFTLADTLKVDEQHAYSEHLTISDRMYARGPLELNETFSIGDSFTALRIKRGVIKEHIRLSDTWNAKGIFQAVITEDITISDGLLTNAIYQVSIVEGISMGEAWIEFGHFIEDTFSVGDTFDVWKRRIPKNRFVLFMRRPTDKYEVDMMPIPECCDNPPDLCCGTGWYTIGLESSVTVEIVGGCAPFTWALTGNATLLNTTTHTRENVITVTSAASKGDTIGVTITDSCDESIQCALIVAGLDCCEDPDYAVLSSDYNGMTLFIDNFTSLRVEVEGGCPPFRWLTGNPTNYYWTRGEWTNSRWNILKTTLEAEEEDCASGFVLEACGTSIAFDICPLPDIDRPPGIGNPDGCEYPDVSISWDEDNPETAIPGNSIILNVLDGVGPFWWELVEGETDKFELAWEFISPNNRSNVLTPAVDACGYVKVRVTDMWCNETCEGIIDCTVGRWVEADISRQEAYIISAVGAGGMLGDTLCIKMPYRYDVGAAVNGSYCMHFKRPCLSTIRDLHGVNPLPTPCTSVEFDNDAPEGTTVEECCALQAQYCPEYQPCDCIDDWNCQGGWHCGTSSSCTYDDMHIYEWVC